MMDLEQFAAQVLGHVRAYIQPALDELSARIDSIPAGKDGAPGTAGKDGRDGIDGKDGAPGVAGAAGVNGKDGAPGVAGAPGVNGKDGAAGVNGKDGAPGVAGSAGKDGAPGVNGKDGAAGVNGKDGRLFTIEEARALLETMEAKWALNFERRAQLILQNAVDKAPKAKDGVDGKNGRDGLPLEALDAVVAEDGRTVVLSLTDGETKVEKHLVFPVPVYKEVYKVDTQYQRGDFVTWGGSMWIATRDTTARPETDDSWRLAVKRGRDGKDAPLGRKKP